MVHGNCRSVLALDALPRAEYNKLSVNSLLAIYMYGI